MSPDSPPAPDADEALSRIEEKVFKADLSDAVEESCEESGCNLQLNDLPNRIVLKGESLRDELRKRRGSLAHTRDPKPICDCLIFVPAVPVIACIVELKSQSVDISRARAQLERGTRYATWILEAAATPYEMYHFLLSQRDPSRGRRPMQRNPITYRGQNHYIMTAGCGSSLIDLLRKYAEPDL